MDEPEPPAPEERTFTVSEADETLPWLREVLPRIREARQLVLAGAERLKRGAALNGGGAHGNEYWEALRSLRRDVEDVTRRGIVLRDPETGLVDFPTEREGERVLLCWRLGEDRVGFWHSPQAGFAGRQPL